MRFYKGDYMISKGISLFFGNLGFILFIIAILIATTSWTVQKIKGNGDAADIFFKWVALLPLGITGIYTFLMHGFFPEYTAATIGWPNSPFQYEVAIADLAFGLLGILSFRANYGFRLATVIGSTCWLWGDAIGHIYQMIFHQNFTIGNAGSWFWMDIIIPLVLILCIIKHKK